jgi:tetratricopeptide (TPR) repeat protein
MRKLAILALLAAATVAAASRLQPSQERPYNLDIVPGTAAARWTSLGHPTLVANLWWLRAVQYIGDPNANKRGWEKLYPAVNLVTDLDPRHGYAYQVAGVILGAANRIEESNAILEKGIRNVPDRYILPFLRAFNAFFYAGDYALAGRYYELAAKVPGAPNHLRQNVLAMYVKGRRADAAIGFLRHSLEAAPDDDTRNAVQEQIRQAEMEKAASTLDEAHWKFVEAYGLSPASPAQFVIAGLLPAVPQDPYGGTFVLGTDGRYHSSVHPGRFSPPESPRPWREPGIDKVKR